MPEPRYGQTSAGETPYVLVVSRVVRRSFSCGKDKLAGKNYNYRRQWFEDEILLLSGVFALDKVAYSVMSNHYHIILYNNLREARGWSDEVVWINCR